MKYYSLGLNIFKFSYLAIVHLANVLKIVPLQIVFRKIRILYGRHSGCDSAATYMDVHQLASLNLVEFCLK